MSSRKNTLLDRTGALTDAAFDAAEAVNEKAQPLIQDVKKQTKPILKSGKKIAKQRAKEAKALAAQAAAASKDAVAATAETVASAGEDDGTGRKPRRLRKLLVLVGIAGLGAFVAKKLRDQRNTADDWQSAYVPTPEPPAEDVAEDEPAADAADQAGEAEPTVGRLFSDGDR